MARDEDRLPGALRGRFPLRPRHRDAREERAEDEVDPDGVRGVRGAERQRDDQSLRDG